MADGIARDLGIKCAKDIEETMRRTLDLADPGMQRAIVMIYGAATAMTLAVASLDGATGCELTPDGVFEKLIGKIRPLVMSAMTSPEAMAVRALRREAGRTERRAHSERRP